MNTQLTTSYPSVIMGKTVVARIQITVKLISEKLSAGETPDQILQTNPRLTKEGIYVALSFAAQSLRADVVCPVLAKAA